MVLMAASLGLPADLARLEEYLAKGSGNTQTYALEALARHGARSALRRRPTRNRCRCGYGLEAR
jgi:hypothetical protein